MPLSIEEIVFGDYGLCSGPVVNYIDHIKVYSGETVIAGAKFVDNSGTNEIHYWNQSTEAFEDSGILVELWSWIGEATQKMAAKAWNNLEIWRSFKNAGITIPFPQVDLHVKEPLKFSRGGRAGGSEKVQPAR